MRQWRRFAAAAGTAAMLLSNIGAVVPTVWAAETAAQEETTGPSGNHEDGTADTAPAVQAETTGTSAAHEVTTDTDEIAAVGTPETAERMGADGSSETGTDETTGETDRTKADADVDPTEPGDAASDATEMTGG